MESGGYRPTAASMKSEEYSPSNAAAGLFHASAPSTQLLYTARQVVSAHSPAAIPDTSTGGCCVPRPAMTDHSQPPAEIAKLRRR